MMKWRLHQTICPPARTTMTIQKYCKGINLVKSVGCGLEIGNPRIFPFRLLAQLIKTNKGRRQNSLPLTTNFSQNVTEPSKEISYPVDDLCRHFTKLTWPCAYTLHSNPIPPTDGTNDRL